MGVKHKEYNIHGVQFHPESIKTTLGIKILKNFIIIKINGKISRKLRNKTRFIIQ